MVKRILGNKILKNASWIIACKLAQSVLSLIISMLTARYLGPSNFGLINYAISLAAFVLPITELGLSNIMVQEIVENRDSEGEILGTSLILSEVSAVLCIIGINAFVAISNPQENLTRLVCLCYSSILFFQALDLMRYWYQAKYLAKYTSLISLFAFVIISIYKIILLSTGKSIIWFSISYSFDFALIAIMSFYFYKKRLKGQRLSFNKTTAIRLFGRSHYYILSSLMVSVFAQTDKIMLKLMLTEADVGFYSAATTCAALSGFVFQAIIDSVRPSIFESQKVDKERFENKIITLYSIIIYSCLFISILTTIFSKWIVLILYGRKYESSIAILRISVWYITFSFLGVVRNIWILAESKQSFLWKINLLGALANVLLNYLLIPSMGAIGAAVASVITQIFTNVIVGYIIKPIRKNNSLMIKGLNIRVVQDFFKNNVSGN